MAQGGEGHEMVLLEAVMAGDVDAVTDLLAEAAAADAATAADTASTTEAATADGHQNQGSSRVQMLLAAAQADGRTALHQAATSGLQPVVARLLEAGAAVDVRDADDFTPLTLAGCVGSVPVVQQLILPGADVTAATRFGNTTGGTALHFAAYLGEASVVQALLDAGAAVEARAEGHLSGSAFVMAAVAGHTSVLKLLAAAGADINAADSEGDTAMHHAAYRGYTDAVAWLLATGLAVNTVNVNKRTALYLAVRGSDENAADTTDIVKLLLAAGADVDTAATRGAVVWNALAVAASQAASSGKQDNFNCLMDAISSRPTATEGLIVAATAAARVRDSTAPDVQRSALHRLLLAAFKQDAAAAQAALQHHLADPACQQLPDPAKVLVADVLRDVVIETAAAVTAAVADFGAQQTAMQDLMVNVAVMHKQHGQLKQQLQPQQRRAEQSQAQHQQQRHQEWQQQLHQSCSSLLLSRSAAQPLLAAADSARCIKRRTAA